MFLHRRLLVITLLLTLLLTGCGEVITDSDLIGAGGGSPRQVVESFLEDLNSALNDPELSSSEVRRAWAERLSGHFTPSERTDQRAILGEMLQRFVISTTNPALGARATLEVSFSVTELVEQQDERALVRVVDGLLTLRFYSESGELLRERSNSLSALIGLIGDRLPTRLVGGRWFMTEG